MPIARAAPPRVRSSVTPRVNGPRSLITTVTDFPFSGFVTVTCLTTRRSPPGVGRSGLLGSAARRATATLGNICSQRNRGSDTEWYANECPPQRTGMSGANPNNSYRHRQAHGEGGGNRRRECEQQIFCGLHPIEFRHGLLQIGRPKGRHRDEAMERLPSSRTLCPEAPGNGCLSKSSSLRAVQPLHGAHPQASKSAKSSSATRTCARAWP